MLSHDSGGAIDVSMRHNTSDSGTAAKRCQPNQPKTFVPTCHFSELEEMISPTLWARMTAPSGTVM